MKEIRQALRKEKKGLQLTAWEDSLRYQQVSPRHLIEIVASKISQYYFKINPLLGIQLHLLVKILILTETR
jgi:hypothetical protein